MRLTIIIFVLLILSIGEFLLYQDTRSGNIALTEHIRRMELDIAVMKKELIEPHDQLMIENGHLMVKKAGVMQQATHNLIMSDGTRVMMDGMVKTPDGKEKKLKTGDVILWKAP